MLRDKLKSVFCNMKPVKNNFCIFFFDFSFYHFPLTHFASHSIYNASVKVTFPKCQLTKKKKKLVEFFFFIHEEENSFKLKKEKIFSANKRLIKISFIIFY